MPDDATENMATHRSRLQPSIISMSQLQPLCLAAPILKFTTLKSGMKTRVILETTIEPHDLVTLTRTLASQAKGKTLLDYRCPLLLAHAEV